jgi:ABC-type branched-subunit amino acid transport system substrate-binding protein
LQRKLLAIIGVIIIVVATIAAIELTPKTPSTPSADARNIKIGLVAPLSTSIGQDMSDASQMAVKEINDAGGI